MRGQLRSIVNWRSFKVKRGHWNASYDRFWGHQGSQTRISWPLSSFLAAGVIWLVVTFSRRSRLNCVSIDCELSISAGANFPRGACFPAPSSSSLPKMGFQNDCQSRHVRLNELCTFFLSRLEAGKPQENQKGTQSAAAFFGLSTLFEIVTPKTIDKFLTETATGFATLKLWN